jgi:hypothetical protein
VRQNGYALQYVPENLKTAEMCLAAVKEEAGSLPYVPENLKTAEICLVAVKKDGYAIQYVPPNLMTAEMCLERVKKDGKALEDVPEKLRTAQVCLAAVKQTGWAMEHVPENLKTLEFCLKAVKQNGAALAHVPENYKTAEMCFEAVKQNGYGYAIRYVPWGQLNLTVPAMEELCLIAMKSDKMLEKAPQKLTVEICLEAVRKNYKALEYVPWGQSNLTDPEKAEICHEAVNYSGWVGDDIILQYVPENYRTIELCYEAVRKKGEALQYVPENLKTIDLCYEAVKMDGDALQWVPKNFKTTGMYLETVRAYSRSLHEFRYPDRYGVANSQRSALRNDIERVLKEMPEELKTQELCFEAVKENGAALAHVPEHLRTPELCLEAVKQNGGALQYVPWGQINLSVPAKVEFCIDVVKKDDWTLQFVPETLREEVGRRAKSVGVVNIGALTQEKIHFEFFRLTEKELNSVPPKTPDRKFSVESDFVTGNIDVYVTIPEHREVPKSITVKLTNIGPSAEQREAAFNCEGRVWKGELEGIVILHASPGKPRVGQSYRQKAEITLNFESRSETLICPISRTTTFSMSFFEAYKARSGKPDSVDSVNEFPE